MCPGITDDLRLIDDARKTAIINRELKRLNIDIAGLQETRLLSDGSLREQDYTYFWQGKEQDQPRQHGVGFAVRNTLLSSIEPPTAGTERFLSLRLSTSSGPVNIMNVYAPTLCSSTETKDQFYEELDSAIRCIATNEDLFLIPADHSAWSSCLGHFGVGKMNENGQRLLELCSYYNLCISKHFLQYKTMPQSVLETFQIPPLASAGPHNHQKIISELCEHHPQLP
ncbi:craniofacial development protein 2-like [Amphiura filiformis]|uniref:craniofacial development protein 2-like n=1 Tax=Amphiura filiformis TaxID=82378 RepID=UPI003B22431D